MDEGYVEMVDTLAKGIIAKIEKGDKPTEKKEYPATIGFWKQNARFNSSVLKKKLIPKGSFRIQVIKNYYKKAKNQPDYIGYLVEANDEESLCVDKPLAVLRADCEDEYDNDRLRELCDEIRNELSSIGSDARCAEDDSYYAYDHFRYIHSAISRIEGLLNDIEEL